MKDTTEGKKGSNVYMMPNFEMIEISKATEEKALDLDVVVQDYLSKYLSTPVVEHEPTVVTHPASTGAQGLKNNTDFDNQGHMEPVGNDDDESDLPF